LYLKSKSNISSGGDPIDATDEIPDSVKKMAVAASNAIPGLVQSGVDVIYDKGTNNAVILEINTLPSIRTHLFPMEGKARDIPSAIIDYYFPETKPNHGQPCYYFDLQRIWEVFRDGVAEEIAVPDHPKGELTATRFLFPDISTQ